MTMLEVTPEPLFSSNARSSPSGDQLGPADQSSSDVGTDWILRSGPPSAGMTKSPLPSPERRKNAMWRPSGDQVGKRSGAGFLVNRSGTSVPMTLTKISSLSPFSLLHENAIRSPSGEKLAWRSMPGRLVNGIVRISSRGDSQSRVRFRKSAATVATATATAGHITRPYEALVARLLPAEPNSPDSGPTCPSALPD